MFIRKSVVPQAVGAFGCILLSSTFVSFASFVPHNLQDSPTFLQDQYSSDLCGITMVADKFSMEDDIKCFNCKENVNLGDDYEAHLLIAHDIRHNYPFYMQKAVEQKINRKMKRKDLEPEVQDVDDDTEPDSEPDTEPETEPDDNVGYANSKKSEPKFESQSENFDEVLTHGLVEIIDIFENKYEQGNDDIEIEDGKDYEEELWKAFDKIKSITKDKKLPIESKKILMEKVVANEVAPIEDAADKSETPEKQPSYTRPNNKVELHQNPPNKEAEKRPTSRASNQSDQSTRLYKCPKCDTKLGKEKLKGGMASKHLIKEHGATPELMKMSSKEWKWSSIK